MMKWQIETSDVLVVMIFVGLVAIGMQASWLLLLLNNTGLTGIHHFKYLTYEMDTTAVGKCTARCLIRRFD